MLPRETQTRSTRPGGTALCGWSLQIFQALAVGTSDEEKWKRATSTESHPVMICTNNNKSHVRSQKSECPRGLPRTKVGNLVIETKDSQAKK